MIVPCATMLPGDGCFHHDKYPGGGVNHVWMFREWANTTHGGGSDSAAAAAASTDDDENNHNNHNNHNSHDNGAGDVRSPPAEPGLMRLYQMGGGGGAVNMQTQTKATKECGIAKRGPCIVCFKYAHIINETDALPTALGAM